ncbi:hypothetical protein FNV43_RR04174 [Rhamnella rubrinervis]|uniref:Auxin-responsive protein n=1 Tax=Rhamnella rubrinervis TaxID=2594499 RepID=A0A8K0HLE0_9ROSA|nr:hypothetical protein FNV43_RR04174 [Rhamnella rubrinervis]
MELRLGLALPGNTNPVVNEFDLNNNFVFEPKDVPSSNPICLFGPTSSSSNIYYDTNTKKRSFCQAFVHNNKPVPRTLPLLLSWNNHPNDEDDDPKHLDNNYSSSNNIKNGDGLVGWPPIKQWRKKLCSHGGRAGNVINRRVVVENGCGCGGRISKSMYVKVKMEGVAIARKVDLSVHHGLQTLIDTLIDMFGKCQEESNNYKLAYQDREGDWLLADQDVPWRTFTRSVQRLKLLKRSH